MQIKVTVVQNVLKSATNKNGKEYKVHEVAYKNHSFQDKLEEAKVNSYNKLFPQVGEMQAGQSFLVDKEKNDGGFWEWQKISPISPTDIKEVPVETKTVKAAIGKSTYETPEERAKKQVYIVKQSAINYAIQALSPGAKTALKTEEILVLAQKFANWVFSDNPALAFDDIPDDFPGEVTVS
jgi:hypothetical protein